MMQLTKIFHFEMAHAIYGYQGACKNIHGHSYELHVTLAASESPNNFINAPGFIIDFKQIKKLVSENIIDLLDHKLILSEAFLVQQPVLRNQENLIVWEMEPSAENILFYVQKVLKAVLPNEILLVRMKLYETKDSYVEWIS